MRKNGENLSSVLSLDRRKVVKYLDGLKGKLNKKSILYLYSLLFRQTEDVRDRVLQTVIDYTCKTAKYDKLLEPFIFLGLNDNEDAFYVAEAIPFIRDKQVKFSLCVALLNHKDDLVRVNAVENLYEFSNPMIAGLLEDKISDKDALVRSFAVYGLAMQKSTKSVKLILKQLQKERSPMAKVNMFGALFVLTRDYTWYDKMIKSLSYKNHLAPMQVRYGIGLAIDRGILNKNRAVQDLKASLGKIKTIAASGTIATYIKSLKNKRKDDIKLTKIKL